jgi:hypothetical protein
LTVSESPSKEHGMELNVHKEVAALQRQGAKQLRARYAEVFGEGVSSGRVGDAHRTGGGNRDGTGVPWSKMTVKAVMDRYT